MSATAGCQRKDGIPVQSVTGKVTYKGEPLEGALVSFDPIGASGRGAQAYTGPDGSYTLETYAANSAGAVLGDYNVFIEKNITVDQQGNEYTEFSPGGPATKHLTPKKYSSINGQQAVLKATVEKGKNVFNFDLED